MKTKIKYLSVGLIIGILLSSFSFVFANSQTIEALLQNVKVVYNGKALNMTETPIMYKGRFYFPIRLILEATNAKVDYDGDTNTINVTKEPDIVYVTGVTASLPQQKTPETPYTSLTPSPPIPTTTTPVAPNIENNQNTIPSNNVVEHNNSNNNNDNNSQTVIEEPKKQRTDTIGQTPDGIPVDYIYGLDGKPYVHFGKIKIKLEAKNFKFFKKQGQDNIWQISDSNKNVIIDNIIMHHVNSQSYMDYDYYIDNIMPLTK